MAFSKTHTQKFPFLVPLLLKWKSYKENELTLGSSRTIPPSPLWSIITWLTSGLQLSLDTEEALSDVRLGYRKCGLRRPFYSIHLTTAPESPFSNGYRRALQPPDFLNGLLSQECHIPHDKNGLFLRVQEKFGSFSFFFCISTTSSHGIL